MVKRSLLMFPEAFIIYVQPSALVKHKSTFLSTFLLETTLQELQDR